MNLKPLLICAALGVLASPAAIANSKVDEVRTCLANWGEHPFDASNPQFRTISASVKVFGVGSDIVDQPTRNPELVLIEPNVSVMTKSTMNLLNPNGWYCLRKKVNVMSKSVINLHCDAHLASTIQGATVLGSNQNNDGVTVMGKAVINRVGCN